MFAETLRRNAPRTDSELASLDPRALDRLDGLTLGDFAAVVRQLEVLGGKISAAELLAALEAECAIRGESSKPFGFAS